MDRRLAMVGTISAVLLAACAPAPASPAPASPAALGTEPAAVATPTAAPDVTAAPSPSPFGSWAPATVARLAAVSSVALGDFFPQRLEAVAGRYLLTGQDGQGNSFLVEGSASGGSWSRLDVARLGTWIGDVAGGPLGAVLSIDDQASGQLVGLWYSSDGLTWGRVDLPSLAGASAEHLSAGPGGFAMTADIGASGSESGSSTSTVWTSTNGHDWTDVPSLQSAGIASVTPLAGAFVASGMNADNQVVVEVSKDGRTFHTDPNAATSPLASTPIVSLAAGSKLLVLEATASGRVQPWTGQPSADGTSIAWTRGTADPFVGRQVVVGASSSGGVTLLGYDGQAYVEEAYAPVVWTSPDGTTFAEHDLGGSTFAGGVSRLLAASASGLATLGWTSDSTDRVVRSIWQASDGSSWSAAPSDLFGALGPLPSGSCPASPTTAEALMIVDAVQLPACYGNRTISVTGYVTGCGGCGGTVPYVSSPSWLIDALGFANFWLAPQIVPADGGPQGLGVQVDPAHPISVPKVGTHVRLAGHFDDAASSTCRTLPVSGSGAELMPPSIAILRCRETFVATSVTILK